MQQDLLTELKLPSLDNENLERIVRQNATRLSYLIEAHNIYVKNSAIIKSLIVEKNKKPSLPCLSKTSGNENNVLGTSDDTKKEPVIINNNDEVESSERITGNKESTSTTLASNLGWDSSDENESQSPKTRSYPSRYLCDSSCLWEPEFPIDGSLEFGPNICGESEFLLDIKTESEEKKFQAPVLEASENLDADVMFSRSSNESVRCYPKRKMTDIPSTSESFDIEGEIVKEKVQPSENNICCISEVVGNAVESFFETDTDVFTPSPITPKKTNDITKIKGWRRKQFSVEKARMVEATVSETAKEIKVEKVEPEKIKTEPEEPKETENAFVCDSLDEFLETDAELKVNYEIPHLYAEVGIKLTSEEIASKPNLSVEDFKEVESKYCIPVPNNTIGFDSDDSKSNVKVLSDSELETLNKQRVVDVKRRLAKSLQKQVNRDIKDKLRTRSLLKSNSNQEIKRKSDFVKDFYENFKNVNLAVKLIGLVVNPGPNKLLHPLIRRHLLKLRSYHTKIDENWANFAVSAVVTKNENPQLKILPVVCCGKIATGSKVQVGSKDQPVVDTTPKRVCTEPSENSRSKKIKVPEKATQSIDDMKNCKVVVDKLKVLDSFRIWCMEHHCYYCSKCGLNKVAASVKKSESKKVVSNPTTTNTNEIKETVFVSKTMLDKTIASLLAKKLKVLRSNGDTVTSIDCLKTTPPNTVELIKLNFIKQSFLTGYVNIWHLKPGKDSVRSRAFLTFSKIPPMPNTMNLKSIEICQKTLPKVITEIISGDKTFDPNEYAILHCNGEVWEIHGCLNLRAEKKETVPQKCVKGVEQIFTPCTLPELPQLQRLAQKILGVKVSKWWVLDLSQKFDELSMKSNPIAALFTRQRFMNFIKSGMFGFVFVKLEVGKHPLGAYVFQNLVPFVLIGPYFVSEDHDLTLKADQSPVRFVYRGEKNSSRECPLKFFVNSVLTEYQETGSTVEGLWLYDKTVSEETCYLEVMTTTEDSDVSKSSYNIHAEHGYSLNAPRDAATPMPVTSVKKSGANTKVAAQKTIVYLYFEVSDLGYLQGELQPDNGVIIHHPLDNQTRVKSPKVGDWFLRLIRRRIRFIPKNLQIRWFITKHKEDLRERQPFNKFYLGGAHILCKKGLFFMLDLTESKMNELGVDKKEIKMAIAKSKVINEVKELKTLANVLCVNTSTDHLSMEQVLKMAIDEIQTQKNLKKNLRKNKLKFEVNMIIKCWRYLREINSLKTGDEVKFELVDKIKDCFLSDRGDFDPGFIKGLVSFDFGRKYLFNRKESLEKKKAAEEDDLLVLYVKRDSRLHEHKYAKPSLPELPSTNSKIYSKASILRDNLNTNTKSPVQENAIVPVMKIKSTGSNKNSGLSPDTSVLKNQNAGFSPTNKKFMRLEQAIAKNLLKNNRIRLQKMGQKLREELEWRSSDEGEDVGKLQKRKYEAVDDDDIEVIAEILNHKTKRPCLPDDSSAVNGSDIT